VTATLAIAILRLLAEHPQGASASFSVTHIEDLHPRIIHIYNLDDGPRDIVLRRMQFEDDDSSRPIQIFNGLDKSVREVVHPQE
jgi:hypothetical protein